MMQIPGCDQAIVDIRKLTGYCLNINHARGKHKARVFISALGITVEQADMLSEKLLSVVCNENAVEISSDIYGQRYQLDFMMTTDIGGAIVRSGWIIRKDEEFPRLATCYVLRESNDD